MLSWEVLSMERGYWVDLEARARRLEEVRNRAERVREAALVALGKVCPKCFIPKDSRDMRILPLSEEGRKWSKQLLFRRIAEAFKPGEVARLLCKECLFNESQEKVVAKEKGKGGTGEFYWIGGQRVEQVREVRGVSLSYECLVIHPRHEDLKLGDG